MRATRATRALAAVYAAQPDAALSEPEAEAALAYGAYSLPTSFFINAKGHVIAQAVGAIDGATLQKGIDMIVD